MNQKNYVDLNNAGDFPLAPGFRVIEAGAGTGKTFNLVRLVLRLIVGHSRVALDPKQPDAGYRVVPITPVAPKNILLVTFTEAAAMEMRQRLQELLEDVASLKDERPYEKVEDDDLRLKLEILQAIPDAAEKINAALPQLGFMQISTIHTFCMRAYSEHAVPCGFPPLGGEPTEGGAVAEEIAADWLRFQKSEHKPDFPMKELTKTVQALMADDRALVPAKFATAKPSLPEFVRARSSQAGAVTFDDLIVRMHRAVHGVGDGDDAARSLEFLDNLRDAYRLCLVDEAQDTDQQQMEIFRKIFDEEPDKRLLVLVGDPKQSIYGFRGANVDVYSQAAQESIKPIFNLRTTRRSSPRLVKAFNALFSTKNFFTPGLKPGSVETPKIFYPQAVAFEDPREPSFVPVGGSPIQTDFAKQPADVARHACLLLRELEHVDRTGRKQLAPDEPAKKGLAQVAILVRSNSRANQIYRALAKMDMDVSVETDQCIFETTTAFQVLLLLRAVLRPADMGLRKTLILSRPSLFGPHAKLDNNALSDLAEWLRDCRDTWEKHGFAQCWEKLTREAPACTLELPAVSKKTFAEMGEAYRLCSVFESLACSSLSRRSLVDLAHVGELLITRSHRNHWDMHQLVNYASVRIKGEDDESDAEDSGSASEEEQLRPDSTSARILVRTIHKAKGLEYNAVIVDQAFNFSKKKDAFKSGERFKGGADGTKTRIYSRDDFGEAEDAKRKELLAEIEVQRMEEDARLFYVALTRAKQKVLLLGGQADTEDKHPKGFSALFARLGLSPDFCALDEKYAEHIGHIDYAVSPDEDKTFCGLRKENVELDMESRRLPAVPWRQGSTSYSSLSEDRKDSRKPKKPSTEVRDFEPEEVVRALPSPADQAVKLFLGDVAPDLPLKPANMNAAEFGNVLHDLLEELDFARIDQADYLEKSVRRVLADASVLEGGKDNQDDALKVAHLVAACRAWLETPIAPPQGVVGSPIRLRDVTLRDRMSEARFAYSSVIDADGLGRLKACFSGLEPSLSPDLKPISGLSFPERAYGLNVDGLLIGFIDLVFRSPTDGKYYLLDWKTNFLGNSIRDYNDASMSAKMAEARYHLQFSLYASVLDEHMKRSVVGWNYDQHFGGIIYLFLRGFGASPQHHPRAGAFCFKPTAAFVGKVKAALNAQSDEQS